MKTRDIFYGATASCERLALRDLLPDVRVASFIISTIATFVFHALPNTVAETSVASFVVGGI
jgi:hypothetical protein